ncbi:MAG TPA: hypothetical protein VGG29_08300 [Caulobacteraceae bacterium]|jgi:hypothetical protein
MNREEILGRDALIRLECAELAEGRLSDARALYEFVTDDASRTPKERILAAMEEAGVK